MRGKGYVYLLALGLLAGPAGAQVVYLFEESFDAGLGAMTATNGAFTDNSWHFDDQCPAATSGAHSIAGTARFSRENDCDDYGDNGSFSAADTDLLTSPAIDISACNDAFLSYTYLLDYNEGPEFDRARVEISIDGGAFQVIADNSGSGARGPGARAETGPAGGNGIGGIENTGTWIASSFDLSTYGAGTVTVRFVGELSDQFANNGEGFVVDDVVVSCRVPIQAVPAISPAGLAALAGLLAVAALFAVRRFRRA